MDLKRQVKIAATLVILVILLLSLEVRRRGSSLLDNGSVAILSDPFDNIRFPSYRNLSVLYSESPDVFSALPETFLPNYRSFCWRNPDQKLACLPAVYVAGMPKCGSTELFRKLVWHPDMVSPKTKENHYWARRRLGKRAKQIPETFSHFLDRLNVRRVDEEQLLVDGTQSVLWDQSEWETRYPWAEHPPYYNSDIIHHITPRAKILIILRNPVTRLYSDYLYFAKRENRTAHSFAVEASQAVDSFRGCLRHNSVHSCCYNSTITNRMTVRLHIGIYICYIIDWKAKYGDNLFLIKLEDFSTSPKRELIRIWEFLEVKIPDIMKLEQFLESAKPANTRKNTDTNRGEMFDETYRLLDGFYRPYNLLLAKFSGERKFTYE